MTHFIERVMNPDWYHGRGKKPPFFEGWYFKLIDAAEGRRYAVIPGIFLSDSPDKHHAFVQVLDGQTGEAAYFRFPPEQFIAAENDFDVKIGANRLRRDSITLNLEGDRLALKGELRFENTTPYPVSWAAPGIMGPFGWLTFMECYHGVVSLDHTIRGTLTLDGQPVDFSGGRGYIEKDWGQSFPSAWVWMQTNHFDSVGTCLTASIATIPFKVFSFTGAIVGLWHEKQLYLFATYNGVVIERLSVTDTTVDWVLRNGQHRLTIQATRAQGGLLHEPNREEMHRRVEETLQASVHVRLTELETGREIFSGVGRCAGLEVQGHLNLK